MRIAWIVLKVGSVLSCLGLAVAQPAADFSTPENALSSLRRAFRDKDSSAIVAGTYAPAQLGQSVEVRQRAVAEGDPRALDFAATVFSSLVVRQVDDRATTNLRLEAARPDGPFDRVARVLCTVVSDRDLFDDHRLTNVVALYFVHHDGQWRWYNSPYDMWHPWSYDTSTPERARRSLRVAVEAQDVQGVYDMIDPDLVDGVSREQFMRVARERLDANARWETECKTARKAAKAERRPVPKLPEQPYVLSRMNGEAFGVDVEYQEENGQRLARVWWLDNEKKRGRADPKQWEMFVQRGDRWYWRPKPEYTAWPLKANQSTTQPGGG